MTDLPTMAAALRAAGWTVVPPCEGPTASVSYPLPHVSPSINSDDKRDEIGLYWRTEVGEIDCLIDLADRRIVWIGKFDGAYEQGGDVPWPDGLEQMLARLYAAQRVPP